MVNFSKRLLDDIRARCDIVDLIGQHLTLRRAGASFKALCPFHKEKSPSFHVNPQKQIYHCFGCGAGGDVFGYVMQHENVPFPTAVAMLAERAGIALEQAPDAGGEPGGDKPLLYRIHADLAAFYRRCLLETKGAAHARTYLRERDLDDAIGDAFGIGYAPDRWDALEQWAAKYELPLEALMAAGMLVRNERENARRPYYDRFRNRLMFPIRDEQGRVIGFSGRALDPATQPAKYVNSPETPLFRKSRVLYAIDRARKAIADRGEAVVCEGQIDVIRCHAAGCEHAVAAQGTAFTEDHARMLKRYADSVILVFDPDTAGQDAAIRAAAVFMQAGLAVRVAGLPPGQDPDAFIRAQGAAAFQALLERAASVVAFQVDVLSGRENARSEVGAMRISRAVLQTIATAGNAVLRARLAQEAAARLGVPASALLDDLRQVMARAPRDAGPSSSADTPRDGGAGAAADAAAPPPEERELCEHLAHLVDTPELGPLVAQSLPPALWSHPVTRRVAQAMLRAAAEGVSVHAVLESDPDVDAESLRFAAAALSAPAKVRGEERGRVDAARDLILRIWRRELRARRTALDLRMRADGDRALMLEKSQLTLDLDALKTWEHGATVIEMHLASQV